MIIPDSNSASSGYEIANSLKFEPDNTEYMYRTQSDGNKKTWTVSFWFKRTELNDSSFPAFISATSSSWATRISLFNNGAFWVDLGYGTSYYRNITTRIIRDTSAWYHFVVAVDSTQATASDRLKGYINGNLITDWGTQNLPAQNTDFKFFDSSHTMYIGEESGSLYGFHPAGYMAEMHVIEGQQLTASHFGEFDEDTGIWKPKAYTGTYGNNGFYLDFENASSLGADASGNGNNFTLNNITSIDQATDTPTNNFCTLNPLIYYGYGCTISQGAVKASDNSVGLGGAAGTVAVNKGKWYWEFQTNGGNTIIGIQDIEADTTAADNAHETAYTMGLYLLQEYNYVNDSGGGRNDGAVSGFVHANSNWYGIALNMDDNEIEYYVNGVKKGPTFSLDALSDLYVRPFVSSSASILYFNFGGLYPDPISTGNTDDNGYGNFEYAPPSGYYALCSKNLAEFG